MKALNSCRLTWPCDSPNGARAEILGVDEAFDDDLGPAGTSRSTVSP
jgi:hypothetical protein